MKRRFHGRNTRVGNRARRQPRPAISIVRGIAIEIGTVNRAAIKPQQLRGVDGGGIAIELHAQTEAVVEDGGDERPLLGQFPLLFDERCHRNGIVDTG